MPKRPGRKRKVDAPRRSDGRVAEWRQHRDEGPTPEMVAKREAQLGMAGSVALKENAGRVIGLMLEKGQLDDRVDREAARRRFDAGEKLFRVNARWQRLLMLPRRPQAASMAPSDGSVDNHDDPDEYRNAKRDYERFRAALASRGWEVQRATLLAVNEEAGWRLDLVIEGLDAVAEILEKPRKAA